MKREIPINENWLFKFGFDAKCLEADFDWSDFFIAGLPHNNVTLPENYFDETVTRSVMTYSRVLTLPDNFNGKRLLLRFEGILSYAEVYVNGMFVASHRGEAYFEADITAPVKYSYENRIVVKVDSTLRKSVPSAGIRGPGMVYGGIHREAVLCVYDGQDIKDIFVRTPAVSEAVSELEIDVEMFDYYPDTELRAVVLAADGHEHTKLTSKSVQGSKVHLKGLMEGAELWDTQNPYLYTLKISLMQGEKELDTRCKKFGCVRAQFKRDGFYLNNKPIKLIGFNRDDSFPHVGRAMPAFNQREDAKLIKKKLGCNCVRTLGLASRDFIDECNNIGLLVLEDIGGDGYIGLGDWRDAIIETVRAMVVRDRSNPCIIGWGVRVNNSRDCNELYFKTVKMAHDLDETRATVGARNFMNSHLYEDVFGFNDYAGERFSRRTKAARLFVPYLITEHTGKSFACKIYDNEQTRVEHALRHLSVVEKTKSSGRTAGAFGMSLSDFNTGTQRGSGDNVNYYGVTDCYRNFKLAAYAYASQSDSQPILTISGNASPDDYDGNMYVFTNAEKVRLLRNDVFIKDYFPSVRKFPNLSHAPIIIDDFIGTLPEADGISGFKLQLFKNVLKLSENGNALNLRFFSRIKVVLLKKLLKIDNDQLLKLLDKYSTYPPLGVNYKIQAIIGDDVVGEICPIKGGEKKLSVKCDRTEIICDRGYEISKITVAVKDSSGNIFPYEMCPINIRVAGSMSLIGNESICIKGGVGSFYIRSLTSGAARISVSSPYGEYSTQVESIYLNDEWL